MGFEEIGESIQKSGEQLTEQLGKNLHDAAYAVANLFQGDKGKDSAQNHLPGLEITGVEPQKQPVEVSNLLNTAGSLWKDGIQDNKFHSQIPKQDSQARVSSHQGRLLNYAGTQSNIDNYYQQNQENKLPYAGTRSYIGSVGFRSQLGKR